MAQTPSGLTGREIAQGVCNHLRDQLGFACLVEFVLPATGLRVDVAALGRKGEFWIVECKSSVRDLISDHKWPNYTEYCDQFYFAVGMDFPTHLLPDESGLITTDGFDAEIRAASVRLGLAPARRKALTIQFGRIAAARLSRKGSSGA